MSKKGGKTTRTVFDFLMSIDFAVCRGRIDSVNQIWVKDRTIFCGSVQERQDVSVNLPGLFGGDDGEGGCVGTVEVYMGDQDQLVSGQLAARNGLLPDVHPGYRDICHLFFNGRGASLDNVSQITLDADGNPVPPEDEFTTGDPDVVVGQGLKPFLQRVASYNTSRAVALFDLFRAGRAVPTGGNGFRWTSNNPYLPPTKVHVTRVFNMGLNQDFAMIYPIAEIDADGDPVPYVDHLFAPQPVQVTDSVANGGANDAYTFDLADIFGPSVIDDGRGYMSVNMSATGQNFGLMGTGPASGTIRVTRVFRDANGDVVGSPPAIDGTSYVDSGTGDMEFTGQSIVPALARTVEVQPVYVLTFPLFARFENREFDFNFQAGPFGSASGGGAGGSVGNGGIDGGSTGNGTGSGSGGAGIGNPVHCDQLGEGLRMMPNANPAHIIYEAMTNDDFGMGASTTTMDTASFEACAETLHGEFMGLFIKWIQQGDIETLVGEVLDHINAVLFQDPSTGLWNLKLLRDDYVAADAPLLDPSNCTAKNRKRRAWGETVNEVVVKWTDPITEKSASVVAHDLANITLQGGVVSETRDYYGIRDEIVAQRLAERDVATAGYPLFTSQVYVDRTDWQITPGDVRRFSWPEDGIDEMVVRILEVDRGGKKDRQIKLSVTEDIFSVDATKYSVPQGGYWASPGEVPTPFDAEFAMDVPLPSLLRNGGSVTEIDDRFPEVSVGLFGAHDTSTVIDFSAVTDVVLANATSELKTVLVAPDSRALLTGGPIFAQAATLLAGNFVESLTFGDATDGDLFLLGPRADGEHEITMLNGYDADTDVWTLARGVWDTVPLLWPSASRIWQFASGTAHVDPEARAVGEEITYRLLPRTVSGSVEYDEALDLIHTATERAYRPFRPANTQIDSAGFGVLVYDDIDTYPTSMTATWETRNRQTEDRIVQLWTAGSVTPEAGQETIIRVYDLDDTLVIAYAATAATSQEIVFADLGGTKEGYVTYHSETSAGESLWAARRYFNLRLSGYGNFYGENYGG